MNAYADKHVWIIGASSGIGHALAVELAAQGAVLALSARNKDKLHALNGELGGGHVVLPLDVADAQAFEAAAKAVQDAFPRLDSAIFMAAVYNPASLENLDVEDARQTVDINLNGAFNAVHAVLPVLKKQGAGQLALCASVAGYRGLPNAQPYGATKAAMINLAESLRIEERGLDIKLINPGFVRTPMTDKNDFKMPMMIESKEAAKIIARELQTGRFEIHFPKRFTLFVKLLAVLPAFLYFKCISRIKFDSRSRGG